MIKFYFLSATCSIYILVILNMDAHDTLFFTNILFLYNGSSNLNAQHWLFLLLISMENSLLLFYIQHEFMIMKV